MHLCPMQVQAALVDPYQDYDRGRAVQSMQLERCRNSDKHIKSELGMLELALEPV